MCNNIETVKDKTNQYIRWNYNRAIQAQKLENIIMRPGFKTFKDIFIQHLNDCSVTVADVDAAIDILGPNLWSLKGKTVRRGNPHVEAGIDLVPQQIIQLYHYVQLTMDIMFVNKIPFFITLSCMIKFGTVVALPNRQVPTVIAKLKSVLLFYVHCGFKVSVIFAESELEPIWPSLSILNTWATEEHVPKIERYIGTIKDSTRSTYRMLSFRYVPCLILIHLVRNAVFWFNVFLFSDGVSSSNSPWYIMTGHEVSCSHHAVIEFGSYVQTHEEHSNDMQQHTLGAICLGPTGNR